MDVYLYFILTRLL